MTSTKSVEQRLAEAAKKARRDNEALQALREYAAEKARIDFNTLRLRALRLEKEAAAREAFAQGQLGLDRYGLREKLEALGVRYLTAEDYEKEQA